MTALGRVRSDGGIRLATGAPDRGPEELLTARSLDGLLSKGGAGLESALQDVEGPSAGEAVVLVPVESQEIWASGVTYQRSRDARMEESEAPDHYDRVYVADRPELFVKSFPNKVRGPGETIGIRADSTWDVPEPELTVVADAGGEIVAYTIGNDVSSRSIEGENPLYLPQAKVYRGSCALGPCLVPIGQAPALDEIEISVEVVRSGSVEYRETVRVADMRRRPQELVDWLFRAQDFSQGVVLLTGTGLVPDPEFTLRPGDEVIVSATGLGELRNEVERVGE